MNRKSPAKVQVEVICDESAILKRDKNNNTSSNAKDGQFKSSSSSLWQISSIFSMILTLACIVLVMIVKSTLMHMFPK